MGRASVAIANDSAAFVITADDGVYHRLDLPGFDPALYDAGGSEVSGLTLSPDGTKLIYGWQGASEESGGERRATGRPPHRRGRHHVPSGPVRRAGATAALGLLVVTRRAYVVNRVKIADPDNPWG